jgi:formylglycine-generating enzyme required for sulfatase activity
MKHPRITPKSITSLVLLLCALLWAVPAAQAVRVVATTPEGKEIHLYNNSYALVLGNGNYSNGWDPLPGALRDVNDVARALKKNGFNVTLKKNLTRESFNKAFGIFCHKYGRDLNNRLLFYYAGHGHTRKMATNEDLGYLVMVDAPSPQSDPVGFEMASVDMQSMVTRAKTVKARHVLFMFDSCFSGSILNLREQVVPQNISEAVKEPVRQFITAGRANEPVPDHSIFKQAFVDLLEGFGREPIPDGYITGEELGLYLKNTVPRYNPAQHPQYGKIRDIRLDKGDFVFPLASYKKEPEPTASKASPGGTDREMLFWESIKDSGDPALFEAYLRAFPNGIFAPIASSKIESLDQKKVTGAKLPEPAKATLFVEVEPNDAKVRILNIGPKFRQGMILDPGRYHVEVSGTGYHMKREWVTLEAGEDMTLPLKLKKRDEVKVSGSAPSPREARHTVVKPAAKPAPVLRGPEPTFTNNLGMKFVYIKPGSFMMGSPSSEPGRDDDETLHQVTLTKGFYLQTTEVTQGQWKRVLGSNPSNFKNCGDDCPVEKVSWSDIQEFIAELNRMEGGYKYRLPTEAEWEYAARAGTKGPYAGGLDAMAWYKDTSGGKTHAVGMKRPNAWGLYDMHGNVWEWCQDRFGGYPSGSVTDPKGASSGAGRVVRGGSWYDDARRCRSAYRGRDEPGDRYDLLGFRLARAQ